MLFIAASAALVAPASSAASPGAHPNAAATAPAVAAVATESLLDGIAKITVDVLWPLIALAIVFLVTNKLAPLAKEWLELQNRRQALRRQQHARLARAGWEYSESVNVTETVATAVAAAVAVRLIKKPAVEETPDFERLRSIVRRMTQSINSGETKALHGKRIAWVHEQHVEDALERHVFENLGASVRFFTDNESLVKYVKEEHGNVLVIISNRKHWDTADDYDNQVPVDPEAARKLLIRLETENKKPAVFIYSRSLTPTYEGRLEAAGAALCTSVPEVLIHRVLATANEHERPHRHHYRPHIEHAAAQEPVNGQASAV